MRDFVTEKQIETANKIIEKLMRQKIIFDKSAVDVMVTAQTTETKGKCIVWLHMPKSPIHAEIWGTIFEDGSYLMGRAVKDRTVRIPQKTYKITELLNE